MGLLEKAQQKKELLDEEELAIYRRKKRHQSEKKDQDTQSPIETYRLISSGISIEEQQRNLLEKIQHQKMLSEQKSSKQPQKVSETSTGVILELENKKIEIIEEQTGFGWKKQGTKRITYDHTNHEFKFEVIEPPIKEDEKQIKNEISHLFKMLADINTFDMTYDQKQKFLEETIEHIISDNHIYIDEASKDTIF